MRIEESQGLVTYRLYGIYKRGISRRVLDNISCLLHRKDIQIFTPKTREFKSLARQYGSIILSWNSCPGQRRRRFTRFSHAGLS